MKHYHIIAGMMAGAALMLSACDSDLDHNPTIQEPTTFELNTPAFANAGLDLKSSTSLTFSWSQPDYSFPAAAEYQVQIGKSDKASDWTTSTDDEDAVSKGTANYANVGDASSVCKSAVAAKDIATGLEQLYAWKENNVPDNQTFYTRVRAVYNSDTIYSNIVAVNAKPYYVELSDAAIDEWYLIGGNIADGKWTNNASAVGTSVIPLYTEAGEEYNKKTGVGILTYTGYFPVGEFKIIHYLDNWDNEVDVVCKDFVFRDGGSDPGNIAVTEAGYYKITLDPTKRTCKMEKVENQAPAVYANIQISGTINGWGTTTEMTPVSTVAGSINHDWYYDVDATSGDAPQAKFLTGHAWDINWGDSGFPYGYGVQNGSNIPLKAGKYRVFFNDITGQYHFIAQ